MAVALTKGFVVRRHARHPRSPVCSELDIVSQTAQGSAIPGETTSSFPPLYNKHTFLLSGL